MVSARRWYASICACLILSPHVGAAQWAGSRTPEEAAVTALLKDERWTGRDFAEGGHRRAILLSGPAGWIHVDEATNIVVEFRSDRAGLSQPPTGPPEVPISRARELALAFLRRCGVFPGPPWVLTHEKRLGGGDGRREYSFTWRKFLNGVQLPSTIWVGIDADSGQVLDYQLIDDSVTIRLVARISSADATRIVARQQRISRPIVASARPVIWYSPRWPGTQTLFWEVRLRDPDAMGEGESVFVGQVNANTGQINSIYGFQGSASSEQDQGAKPLPKPDLKAAAKAKVPPTVFQVAMRKKPAAAAAEAPTK